MEALSLQGSPACKSHADMFVRISDYDQVPGTLRWTDVPDPGSARPVNSRLVVSIENEKGLLTVMKSMNHR